MRLPQAVAGLIACAALALAATVPGHADAVGDALAAASQALANSNVWTAVDASIDSALEASGFSSHETTRVVPIIGYVGGSGALRLAQISGPTAAVHRVRAVVELDNTGRGEGPWQFAALVPVSSLRDNGHGKRVDGVGITALVTR